MPNIKLTICYDGSNYAGWQIQVSRRPRSALSRSKTRVLKTIQGEIEQALQRIFRKKIRLTGSGRTDAGVHAAGQVAHFKIEKEVDLDSLKRSLNGILPCDISVLKAEDACQNFHARFDAKLRTYRYIIINGLQKPIFNTKSALWVKHSLDVALMRKELKTLLGCHDFKSFQASDHIERNSIVSIKKTAVKKIDFSDALPFFSHHDVIAVDLTADRFLRNMVRNIIGTLIEVGSGKIQKGSLKEILLKKDRRAAGKCVSGCGLYLLGVAYD